MEATNESILPERYIAIAKAASLLELTIAALTRSISLILSPCLNPAFDGSTIVDSFEISTSCSSRPLSIAMIQVSILVRLAGETGRSISLAINTLELPVSLTI